MHPSHRDTEPTVLTRTHFSLSCIVPVFNEEACIGLFLRALHDGAWALTTRVEIIVINDGSHDRSAEEIVRAAQTLPIRYLELSRNFGKEKAIQAGLDVARGDCTLIIDADFQHPIGTIRAMIERWRAGVDVVYGVRRNRRTEPFWKRYAAATFYSLLRQRGQYEIPRDAGDFRLLDRKVVTAIRQLPERNRFMKGLYAWVGFRSDFVEFDVDPRIVGRSRYRMLDLVELALTGLTAFSTRPLRLLAGAGCVLSLLSFITGAYMLVEHWLRGHPIHGFSTVAVAMFFLGGIQLIGLGVLGEYVGRVFEEVKRRPLYLTALDLDHSPLRDVVGQVVSAAHEGATVHGAG